MEETVKILIVDDDEVDRMAVRRALKAAGVQTELSEVSDCAGAIATLQTQSFDCVFLDYFLPDGDGLSLVQQLRALGITVPLVVLTGQGDQQIAVQLIKAGAHDYLSKANITPENLAQVLRQTIRVYRAEQAAAIANERLKESEERYRLVLEGANDGIWDWQCATNQVYCNDRLLEILGVSRSEFDCTTTALIERIHPEDLPRIREIIRNHLTNNEKCEAEFRFVRSSGEYRYCLARGKAQRDANNCPIRMSGVISDNTERKQLENALKESESRFRYLAESNVLGIIVADMQGKILDANDAFLQMVSYTKQDVMTGLYWKDITPPEYKEIDRRAAAEMQASRVLTPFEKEYIRKDGSRVPILIGGALIDNVKEIGICYVLDLSDRKRSEAEIVKLNRDLELRLNELQTLFDVIPIGIAIAQDPECRYIRINPALAKLLNHPVDANASQSVAPEDQPFFKFYSHGKEIPAAQMPMHYAAAHGVDVLDQEFDVVIDNSSLIKLLSYAAPLFDEQGQCRGSIGAFLDITERKRIEEQERFLAEASGLLGPSLDYQTTLENLANLIVPQLADWCTIYVVGEDKTPRQVALTHTDPEKVKWAKEVLNRYPLNPDALIGTPQVIRTGKSELYSQIPDFVLAGLASNTEHLEILHQVGIKSLMCVPMKARDRTLGTIAFYSAESGKTYTPADLVFAEDLGRRAGLAVDNAKLFQQANEIGENLRQALIILGEQQQQLRVLQRITNLLNQRLTNLPGLLQVMVKAVYDGISDAQFALILLHNPETRQLELTATAGVGRERILLMELFDRGDGLLDRAFLTGESQLFKVTNLDDRKHKTSGVEEPYCVDLPASIQAVAIESASAGRLGVLAIGNWENPEAFDIEDQNLLTAVGEQAAIAINNARMIGVLEEREERLAIQNQILARQNRELELNRQRIEQQNLQLIEAARLKSQFLATMSHELRTPMNAIIGFAQVLLRQRTASLSTTQVGMVERILNNGKNLLALINDILDLSKIEAGRLELVPEEFDLAHLINATVAELQPLAEQKQLQLSTTINIDDSQVVNDSVRLRQVLVNLLSNAIKFTETGSVEISVGEPAPMQLILSVKDTGIGIAEAELPNIFEEFRQIDQTTTRKHGGTGLGLAITKSLVQMMQGAISVESKLGQGSTFSINLPRQVTLQEIQ
ncbi:PAS domain S-box protein [Gloeocapsopsis dulcis]|uniref:Circadian input-output histidine kinase CikA n=1 Tax=Gloeocapsopsis dulcis AAB1 = 1H9 TaxID=1433147 RepID=A0A6N8FWB2_9CHRO|nr:PAS domain S-box protein [Gloeocapsopsis dulcis]MUL37418.1 histidine kinase [Gloeocapsopsis dulcis AAB1 = 1H9]WNN87392.1 PAS domain S-box protein [Gloeocapsopsis dulcis]